MQSFLIGLFIVIFMSSAASADKPLIFHDAKTYKETQVIRHAENNKEKQSVKASTYDLNGDFIDEYIVKKFTPNQRLSNYTIVALENRIPITIGTFQAVKLLVSTKKTYGINNIIVYNDENNDFQTLTYAWNPNDFSYTAQ